MTLDVVVGRLRAAGCVFAEDEAALLIAAGGTPEQLDDLVRRRVSGEPLEYVLGWAEFAGLRMVVDDGVFVPRHRTEFLVQEAVALLGRASPTVPVVVDLCCGSGALGAAVAAARRVDLYATDVDPTAVRCARRNVRAAGGQVFSGDLFEPLPRAIRGRVDVLLANVPYVPTEEIALLPPEARLHEARATLDGGEDGLDVLRRVSAEAPRWLAPGGHLLVETSEGQAATAVSVLAGDGLAARATTSDDRYATVVVGTRPEATEGGVDDVAEREPNR